MVDALKGRKALVTGAASGIGRAILLAFREAGAQAVGLDRVAPEGDSQWVLADLVSEREIIRAVNEAGALMGGMDVLVNCAGIELDAPIGAIDTE
ncbi:MAG TPA: SDR family NAD(P)-dependent oxidoreductase, partial [Ancylobacter sp.]